jgi:hypothetical protein
MALGISKPREPMECQQCSISNLGKRWVMLWYRRFKTCSEAPVYRIDGMKLLFCSSQRLESMKDLRSISLCNVIYKLISKVLANHLKCILDEIISRNQNAFVRGRLISHNTILAYEMSPFMKRKRPRKKTYMALKLDMSRVCMPV